jgi:hypothetical protein
VAASTRFGAQELGIGAISPKMVELQLQGDKVADLISSQPCGGLVLDLASSFNFSYFPSLLVFLLQWRISWIFVTLLTGGWKEAYHPPSLMCNIQNNPWS